MGLEIAPATLVALASAFAAALATGFLGSLHCIGMCGSTVAMAIATPPPTSHRREPPSRHRAPSCVRVLPSMQAASPVM
jgi:sulfite exporter TauE/SafE